WDAVPVWDRTDAIEGTIGNVERSSSGATALLIDGRWVTGIPARVLPDGAAPGQFARAVRVRRLDDSTPEEWVASSSTRIRIMPAA
ncbi:hypothetical protein ACT9SR_12855, partial [Enterococcus faecalis]|uniref:hypothetical protein n=1 Tax=Enterococcus faecalis TaxID=1351 RepID=UPI00403A56EF